MGAPTKGGLRPRPSCRLWPALKMASLSSSRASRRFSSKSPPEAERRTNGGRWRAAPSCAVWHGPSVVKDRRNWGCAGALAATYGIATVNTVGGPPHDRRRQNGHHRRDSARLTRPRIINASVCVARAESEGRPDRRYALLGTPDVADGMDLSGPAGPWSHQREPWALRARTLAWRPAGRRLRGGDS